MRQVRSTHYVLYALCLGVLGAFLIWPIVLTVSAGFRTAGTEGQREWTARYVLAVMQDPVIRDSLINSLLVGVFVTALCFVIAVPLAVIYNRFDFRGKDLLGASVLVPLILPPFVGAIGMRSLLGRFGAINSLLGDLALIDPANPIDFLGGARFWGVVIVEALHLYPIVYLNVAAALANIDPAMEQAASNLGASRWTRFLRITLPLIRPGMFAGGTIVFIWSFTELGTPLMFDYYAVAPVRIFWDIQEMGASPMPYALVVVVLVATLVLYLLGKMTFGGGGYGVGVRAMTSTSARRLGFVKGLVAAGAFFSVTAIAVLPHIAVVLTALSDEAGWYRSVLPDSLTLTHFENALGHPLAMGSIRNSLIYALAAVVVDVVLGMMIAYLVVRVRVPGGRLLDGLAMLPLAVPGLVLAFGYVAMTLHWPFPELVKLFNGWGMEGVASIFQITGEAPDPILFLVIAYAVRRLPYVVRSASAGLEQTAGELEDAAANLGASPMYAIRRVVLPLILANLIAGALLAFSFAMLEVSDSLILAQVEGDYPITKAIYALFKRLGDGPYIASAMGVWAMALMTVTLLGASVMLGKKLGAVFRI